MAEIIDKYGCQGYFDGASQGHLAKGGTRSILFFNDFQWIKFHVGVGVSINNREKIMALVLILKLALTKRIQNLQLLRTP